MTLDELRKTGKLIDCKQGTDQWLQTRSGKATSSEFDKATASGRAGNPSKTQFDYLCALLSERTTGNLVEKYHSKYMQWGTDNEPAARSMYEFETGNEVTEIGFVKTGDNIGASVDGIVSDNGMIEIKCKNSQNHIACILKNECPSQHMKQIQGQLWILGREWCDFVSFDPRNPFKDIFIVRVHRDEEFIKKLAAGVNKFVEELLRQEAFIKNGV